MASGAVAASPHGWHYGGFWIRFGARMIDGLVLGVPFLIMAALLIPKLLRTQGDPSNPAFAAFATFGLSVFLGYFLVLICYEVLMLKYRGRLDAFSCGISSPAVSHI
jgi:hypothetical protein